MKRHGDLRGRSRFQQAAHAIDLLDFIRREIGHRCATVARAINDAHPLEFDLGTLALIVNNIIDKNERLRVRSGFQPHECEIAAFVGLQHFTVE